MSAPGGPARVSAGDAAAPGDGQVTFIQYDEPALKDGEYTITVRQDTNQPAPNNSFQASRQFAVAGERFSFDPSDLAAVFPPDLAAGELPGVLPHVLFNRATLPWERSATGEAGAPWLAVLLFDDGQAPAPMPRTVKDLIPVGTAITAAGSAVTGTGTLAAGFASYPGINPLGYGETPDDACTTIDVDAKVFSAIAPAAADLPFLAHIRETDTAGAQDAAQATSSLAVVLGNRVPQDGVTAHAYLVSVENMGPLLPGPDGRPPPGLPPGLPPGVTTVRLLTYRWWSFLATGGRSATFQALLEGVNTVPPGQDGVLSSLQLPFAGPRPDAGQVQQAMHDQAAGSLTGADADVLARNAFALGYVPLVHRLRHGGQTASWYRGPLAPLPVTTTVQTPISCPDAATRYNPQTGMFDISYAAAWQLGLLLALQSRSFSVALCNWRGRDGGGHRLLLRSAVVAGWPDAAAAGYADAERTTPLPLLRSARLGTDVMLCLFDGGAGVVAIHEPPGQLHCGVEGTPGSLTTTLREVTGPAPGHQYDPPQGEATVPARDDGRTLQVAAAATNIMDALNTQFSQGLGAFTSAEFALEMIKGVVEVEFRRGG